MSTHQSRTTTGPASTAGPAEWRAIQEAAQRLRLNVGEEILDGGSPARVHRARTADGTELVLKVLTAASGAVDGHDLASFRGKREQTELIRQAAPQLGAHYLPVRDSIEGSGWAACTTPYYPSRDLAACLREGPEGTRRFFAHHDAVVHGLFVHGYATRTDPAPAGHLTDVNLGRFLRRLPVLARRLPEVAAADELVINDRRCASPARLLHRLSDAHAARLRRLAPPRLMFPAHGDANVRNILVGRATGTGTGDTDYRIIDPRGSVDHWDPVYDLAKTLFSLTVWDPALRLGFAIDGGAGNGTPRYRVGFRRPVYPGYRAAAHGFLPYLETSAIPGLLEGDPGWRQRLLLTHDLHVLAEAPCRLSDLKPKPDAEGRCAPPEELALGHYLMGTLLLDDLVRQLTGPAEPDVDRHLALVTGGPGREAVS
ncbi:hypothetical protein IPZ61_05825 [Streptomyces sioyaensis]|uniref:aminoglycoside phosphotransferase family protein n=1 Tax=Streptomyces sioyaensis TaxID=67364 RepID=UPI001F37D7C1|nr:aminoglycoside phosphotransferase family protein [Streptomyces sioyaensis]MCF3172837.1 hypothetical protein [Streptomyces sioyaensis]